jgi:tetratricopeptide (TPR) repeat protein
MHIRGETVKSKNLVRILATILIVIVVFVIFFFLNSDQMSVQKLLGKDPDSLLQQGQEYLNQRRYEDAAIHFDSMIKKDIALSQAYFGRGNGFLGLRRFDEALRDYTKSLDIERTSEVLASRCNTFRIYTKYEEALRDCHEALSLDSKNTDALLATILLYIDQQKFPEAREFIDEFIQANPENATGYYALAQLQMAEGPSVAAIDSLTRALELDPDNLQFLWDRGFLFYSNGRIRESKADMEKIIKLANPQTDGEILLNAGTILNSFTGYLEDNPNP